MTEIVEVVLEIETPESRTQRKGLFIQNLQKRLLKFF